MLLTIIPVFVLVLLSMVVTRIATIALTLTGLSAEIAKFQARSALTGAGFTTTEAESVVNHPVRRRIIATLMLFGSAGIVSVIASLALGAAQAESRGEAGTALGILVVAIAGLLWVVNRPPVERVLSRLIRIGLRRYTDLEVRDFEALLEVHGGYTVVELVVEPDDWLAGRTLADLRLNDEGLLVLGIQRASGGYDGAPSGDSRVRAGDALLLYGHGQRISELDTRPRGSSGDDRHHASARTRPATDDPTKDPT